MGRLEQYAVVPAREQQPRDIRPREARVRQRVTKSNRPGGQQRYDKFVLDISARLEVLGVVLRENGLVFGCFPLCLSRACLGKMIIFSIKSGEKRDRFLTGITLCVHSTSMMGRICSAERKAPVEAI